MANIDFFKQQAKRFLKDYNSRTFNEQTELYEYFPKYFQDIDWIIVSCDIPEDGSFKLMNAQHIIALLSGFDKWNELIKASKSRLEIGKLLLTNRESYQEKSGYDIVDYWKFYERSYLQDFDEEAKLVIFNKVFLDKDI